MKRPIDPSPLSPSEKIRLMREICREFKNSGIDLMEGFLWYQAIKSKRETVPMTAPMSQADNFIGLSAFDKYCLDHKVIDGGSHA
jgi:hypothetical protein